MAALGVAGVSTLIALSLNGKISLNGKGSKVASDPHPKVGSDPRTWSLPPPPRPYEIPQPYDEKTWEQIPCTPDGDCFYHAVAKLLNRIPNFDGWTSKSVRQHIILRAKYLEDGQSRLYKEALDRLQRGIDSVGPNEWAEREEIELASHAFNLDIWIWYTPTKMWHRVGESKDDAYKMYIELNKNHYTLIKPPPPVVPNQRRRRLTRKGRTRGKKSRTRR